MMAQSEVSAASGGCEWEATECKDGGLRMAQPRLDGRKLEADALATPRLAFGPMKPILSDVEIVASVPSRSLLGALGPTARIALDALRISSANLLF
jgi:hypothetical protein